MTCFLMRKNALLLLMFIILKSLRPCRQLEEQCRGKLCFLSVVFFLKMKKDQLGKIPSTNCYLFARSDFIVMLNAKMD